MRDSIDGMIALLICTVRKSVLLSTHIRSSRHENATCKVMPWRQFCTAGGVSIKLSVIHRRSCTTCSWRDQCNTAARNADLRVSACMVPFLTLLVVRKTPLVPSFHAPSGAPYSRADSEATITSSFLQGTTEPFETAHGYRLKCHVLLTGGRACSAAQG